MFIDELEKIYGAGVPIFAEEIIKLFSGYTRAYVFRMIKSAEVSGQLVPFSRGVYYIPRKTFFGQSSLCSEMVAEKKYIKNAESVYGVYAGLNLLNQFGLTTQVPNKLEIVTNNESTRKRRITIEGRDYILRKARCEITKDNYPSYTILQLFNDMSGDDVPDEFARSRILDYIKANSISADNLFSMSGVFPASALKKMVGSGVLNGIV